MIPSLTLIDWLWVTPSSAQCLLRTLYSGITLDNAQGIEYSTQNSIYKASALVPFFTFIAKCLLEEDRPAGARFLFAAFSSTL